MWKNKFVKFATTTTLAIFFAVTLTGCGSTTSTTSNKSLVIWGFQDEDVFASIIEDFKSDAGYSDLKVTYVKKNLDDYYENDSLNSIMSGQGPDVWAIPNDWVYRHKDKLAVFPDTIFTDGDTKIVPASYFADVVQSDGFFDNKVYALTPSIDVLRIYYNPSLIDAASERIKNDESLSEDQIGELVQILNNMPVTWAELSKVLPWITVKSGNNISVGGIALGTSNNVSKSDDILNLLMLQNKVKMTSDDLQQATFNMPISSTSGSDTYPGKNALEFYTSFSNPNSANYSWNSSMPQDTTAFEQGKLAMLVSTTAYGQYLRQTYPNLDFSQVSMPQSGDINSIIDYADYATYVVPDASPLKDAAQSFVYYLSTTAAPTYISATKELSSQKTDTTETLSERKSSEPSEAQTLTAKSWNKGRYPAIADSQLKQAIERVVNGSQSAQAALDTAAAAITEALRKTSW